MSQEFARTRAPAALHAMLLLTVLRVGEAQSTMCHTACSADRDCDRDWRVPGSCSLCLCDDNKRPPCKAGELMECKSLPSPPIGSCPAGKQWREDPALPLFGSCTRCEVGRVRQARSAKGCRGCPGGRFQPAAGQEFCKACAAGRAGDQLKGMRDSAGHRAQAA